MRLTGLINLMFCKACWNMVLLEIGIYVLPVAQKYEKLYFMGNSISKFSSINSGCPQGSILRPEVFNLTKDKLIVNLKIDLI